MTPHRLQWGAAMIYIVVLLLLVIGDGNVHANDNSNPPSPQTSVLNQPFHADVVSNFLKHRCGSTFNGSSGPSIWIYEGTLTDPLSGKVIAEVEGVELLKRLPTMTSCCDSNNKALLNNLCVRNVLFPEGKSQSSLLESDTATTILSRKLFCYRRPSNHINYASAGMVDTESKDNIISPSKLLLTSIRLRPDGPIRHLSPQESLSVYDSAVTYISRNKGREMVIFSELGGKSDIDEYGNRYDFDDDKKHYVMGSAQSGKDASSFSFSIHALKGTIKCNDGDNGPKLPPLKQPSNDGGDNNEVVISPPRSRLIQFGKGDGSSEKNGAASERKYRSVRESYSYSMPGGIGFTSDLSERQNRNDNTNEFGLAGRLRKQKQQTKPVVIVEEKTPCTVKYIRYGEAPPWYAPGRMCTLELNGKRLDANWAQDFPPLLSWAVSKCKPSFWSGWPAVVSQTSTHDDKENELAKQAVRFFCSESRRSVLPDDLSNAETGNWVSAAENALSLLQNRLKRLSKSFIVSEVPIHMM